MAKKISYRNPKFYYHNKEICQQTSLLCKSRREFYIKYPTACDVVRKNNWLDEFFPPLKNKVNFWTYEKCKEVSSQYKTKKELKDKCEICYKKIMKNNWGDELFSHMVILGNLKKRLIYAQEFPDNSVYVGLTCNINNRVNSHLNKKSETVFKYIEKTGLIPKLKILTDYMPIVESMLKEGEWVDFYKKNGWNVLNISKTGGIGGSHIKWTIETLLNESIKYKNKKEFMENSYNAYCAMYRLKCKDIVCKHMIKHVIKNEKPVLQLTLNGTIIERFDSIIDAHKQTKTRYSAIHHCCEGNYKTGNGFIWKYDC